MPRLLQSNVRVAQLARLWTLLLGILVMACSGTLYAYSVYDTDLSARLGYNGKDSSVIVGLGDAGLYLSGVASGWLVDVYGVMITSILSAVLMTGGYLAMAYTYSVRARAAARAHPRPRALIRRRRRRWGPWTVGAGAAQGAIENANVGLMGFYFMMVGVGSSGAYIAALWPNVRNFSPDHRGLVVGLLVAMTGLSALIFSQLHQAFFVADDNQQDTFGFLVFMAIALGVITMVGAFTLVVVPPTRPAGKPDQHDTTVNSSIVETAAAEVDAAVPDGDSADRAPLLGTAAAQVGPAGGAVVKRRPYSVIRVFKTRDFWLMFVALMCASGAGLMYINRCGSHGVPSPAPQRAAAHAHALTGRRPAV